MRLSRSKVAGARAGPRSLKARLLVWLVPVLLVIMVGALWLSNRSLKEQVGAAYDRSLAGALRTIDGNISTASGGLSMEQPYLMLEFFEQTANAQVFYRVATEDGLAEIGSPALPMPPEALVTGEAQFYEARYAETPVRVAALAREMTPPLAQGRHGRVIIQVAESMAAREVFVSALLRRSIGRDIVGMLFIVAVLVGGIVMSLRPLARLRDELESRAPGDLRPIAADDLPSEVLPLVEAVNRHVARHAAQTEAQMQFLDDASHQLRTPLAVLRMQLGYALRESDAREMRDAFTSMQEGLTRAERMTNQMLALARARDATATRDVLVFERVDLVETARGALRTLWPAARHRRLDIGIDGDDTPIEVDGVEWMLREALINLVDNAIRYTPAGGTVTLAVKRLERAVRVTVSDSGPGMAPGDIERAGRRFRRGAAGKRGTGAGLGLAIVKTISDLHDAALELANREDSPGVNVSWPFPLPADRYH